MLVRRQGSEQARELKAKVKMKETLGAVLKEITGYTGVLAKKRKLGESSDEEEDDDSDQDILREVSSCIFSAC